MQKNAEVTYKWRLSLVAISIVICMATIDTAIVNTALPVISRELGSNPSSAVWIINAYQMIMISMLLPLASLGEVIGYRRVYITGLSVFLVSSLMCGLSNSLFFLILSRSLQGFGAAAIMSVNTALIKFIYPPNKLGQGLGFNALIVAVSFTIAPLVSAAILSIARWEWLFFINIPVGCMALILSVIFLPKEQHNDHLPVTKFDWFAAMLCFLLFLFFILGFGELTHQGYWPVVLLEWSVTLVFSILLAYKQSTHPSPILAIDLLKSANLLLSSLTSICAFTVQGLAFVSLPFLFLTVLHKNQIETGLLITPWSAMVAVMAPIAGRLSDRYKSEILSGAGLLILMGGMVSLAMVSDSSFMFGTGVKMAICGIGFGLFQSPNLRAIMGSVPAARSGSASGIVAISRLLGQTFGAGLVALCLSIFPGENITIVLWIGGGVAMGGFIICTLRWVLSLNREVIK